MLLTLTEFLKMLQTVASLTKKNTSYLRIFTIFKKPIFQKPKEDLSFQRSPNSVNVQLKESVKKCAMCVRVCPPSRVPPVVRNYANGANPRIDKKIQQPLRLRGLAKDPRDTVNLLDL
jgi:hypothetical protein